MIPGVEPAQISVAMRAMEMPGRLRRANERVAEYQARKQAQSAAGPDAGAEPVLTPPE